MGMKVTVLLGSVAAVTKKYADGGTEGDNAARGMTSSQILVMMVTVGLP